MTYVGPGRQEDGERRKEGRAGGQTGREGRAGGRTGRGVGRGLSGLGWKTVRAFSTMMGTYRIGFSHVIQQYDRG